MERRGEGVTTRTSLPLKKVRKAFLLMGYGFRTKRYGFRKIKVRFPYPNLLIERLIPPLEGVPPLSGLRPMPPLLASPPSKISSRQHSPTAPTAVVNKMRSA